MIFRRTDGRLVHSIPAMQKIVPYIMRSRAASINYFQEQLDCTNLDAYIEANEVNGCRKVNAMHLIIAAIVRTIALRPQLNRFIMHSRIYARHDIVVSFIIHRSLRIEDGGTSVKIAFNGTESLAQIVAAVDEAIRNEVSAPNARNATDNLVDAFMSFPAFILRPLIGFVMSLDNVNMLPRMVLEASPFHTTLFLTNLKSLGVDSVYHHQYEFGTNGLFVSMGKERLKAVASGDGSISVKRVMNINFSLDERFCDGLYFAKSMKIFRKHLKDPSLLEPALEATTEDMP